MFTGIVTSTFPLTHLTRTEEAARFALPLDATHRTDLKVGASVALDGVCMTVAQLDDHGVWFDASHETLRRTTLGVRAAGDRVNVERSARQGDEVGGHPMSGHVDGRAEIVVVDRTPANTRLRFRVPADLRRYVFNKGFVGLNGCSLTVVDLDRAAGEFDVWLIPETLRLTTFGEQKVGDAVNLEIDRQTQITVDTVYEAVRAALEDHLPDALG